MWEVPGSIPGFSKRFFPISSALRVSAICLQQKPHLVTPRYKHFGFLQLKSCLPKWDSNPGPSTLILPWKGKFAQALSYCIVLLQVLALIQLEMYSTIKPPTFLAITSDLGVLKQNWHWPLKRIEPARIRTWNLLIRSQTRYPLRHRSRWRTHGVSLQLLQEQVNDISYVQFFKVFRFSCQFIT